MVQLAIHDFLVCCIRWAYCRSNLCRQPIRSYADSTSILPTCVVSRRARWTPIAATFVLLLSVCVPRTNPIWAKMSFAYIVDFVLSETSAARAAKGQIVTAVRSFLRFMACDGTVSPQLVRVIPRVRRWEYADLPKHLTAAELDIVLKACRSEQYGSLRDRAFIAPLARLGVRAGELRHLRLEDIDWAKDSYTFNRASLATAARYHSLRCGALCLQTTFGANGRTQRTVRSSSHLSHHGGRSQDVGRAPLSKSSSTNLA